MESNQIIIGGDVCPTASNVDLFCNGDVDTLFGKRIREIVDNSNGLIFNLEVPLTDEMEPIIKSGPNLIAPAAAIKLLRNLPILCVGLANNHILDQGLKGLRSTLSLLQKSDIPHVGAGYNLSEARGAMALPASDVRICVYACAEHEFTIADQSTAGANPFDPFDSITDIRKLSKQYDRIIVLFHGMKEYYRYPSPETVKRCHALVEAGASIVVCQHSHCIGCAESYLDSHIIYGQGDFCFTHGNTNDMRRTGLLIGYSPTENSVEYYPIVNDGHRVQIADSSEGAVILDAFIKRSENILQEGFIQTSWDRFCDELIGEYTSSMLGSIKPKGLAKLTRMLWKAAGVKEGFRSGKAVAAMLNNLQCEAHREVLATILKNRM